MHNQIFNLLYFKFYIITLKIILVTYILVLSWMAHNEYHPGCMEEKFIITHNVFLLLLGFHSLEDLVDNGYLSVLTGCHNSGTSYLLIDV